MSNTIEKAYYAGGCFWGVEHLLQQREGVRSVISGYMGGRTDNPSYQDICYSNTGHLEVVEVTYEPDVISYEELSKLFFEIHDPTQENGQGPDIGEQYKSAVFYGNEEEKKIIEDLIDQLKAKGYKVVTELREMCPFWTAEEYHQDYYEKKGQEPYCHRYEKKF